EIAAAFFAASRGGDMQALRSTLAEDVAAFADGGGKTQATREPIVGFDEVMRLHESLATLVARTPSRLVRYGFINGLPGFVTVERDDMLQTTALEIENGKIVAIYVVQNLPDQRVQQAAGLVDGVRHRWPLRSGTRRAAPRSPPA